MSLTLILIPTAGESRVIHERMGVVLDGDRVKAELCGFGPVAAAARTSQLIARHNPDRLLLLGIAGSLTSELAPGSATLIDEVAVYGIGAGSGDTYMSAGMMGWSHWVSSSPDGSATSIGDAISLWPDDQKPDQPRQLLTVCAASASARDVRDRRSAWPDAIAEDMEGFSVALAARLADTPLGIIRGISNIAGDRDKARWRIVDALHAATDLAIELLTADRPQN